MGGKEGRQERDGEGEGGQGESRREQGGVIRRPTDDEEERSRGDEEVSKCRLIVMKGRRAEVGAGGDRRGGSRRKRERGDAIWKRGKK